MMKLNKLRDWKKCFINSKESQEKEDLLRELRTIIENKGLLIVAMYVGIEFVIIENIL